MHPRRSRSTSPLRPRRRRPPRSREVPRRGLQGAQIVLVSFAVVIAAGTALLMLPFAKAGRGSATLVEALFTATSAVCVTGLTVVDTEHYWTGFGHVVILVLFQLGGLGIASFASVIGLAMLGRLSIRSRLTVAAEARGEGLADVGTVLLSVVKISAVVELSVSALLAVRFLTLGIEPGRAAWLGLFHGVAAFNQAGFSLFDTGLADFVDDPFVCIPIAVAVML